MDALYSIDHRSPAHVVAGALAHLARHMATGCPRAAHLAALLLDQVANDSDADAHLREHARELVDILERDSERMERATESARRGSRRQHGQPARS